MYIVVCLICLFVGPGDLSRVSPASHPIAEIGSGPLATLITMKKVWKMNGTDVSLVSWLRLNINLIMDIFSKQPLIRKNRFL